MHMCTCGITTWADAYCHYNEQLFAPTQLISRLTRKAYGRDSTYSLVQQGDFAVVLDPGLGQGAIRQPL